MSCKPGFHLCIFLSPCSETRACLGSLDLHLKLLRWMEAGAPLPPPLVSHSPRAPEANPWESCTFPGRHGYVQIGGRKGTWVGSHQRNNMCARHRAGSRALQSKPQKARNYRCLSFSITESLNTSGGTTRPPPAPLQLGGKLSLSNNPQLGYFLLVQGHLK